MSLGQNYYGLFFQGGDPLGMNETELQYPGQLGLVSRTKCRDGIDRDLQIVQADSILGTALTASQVVWWLDQDAYRVTNDPTGRRGDVAGVVGENVDGEIAVNAYTSIVKRGRAHGVKFLDAPTAAPSTAGLIVIPSATAGRADALAAGSAATYPPIGRTTGAQDGTTKIADCDVDVYGSVY